MARIFINIAKKFALRIGSILELEHPFTAEIPQNLEIYSIICKLKAKIKRTKLWTVSIVYGDSP